MTAESRRFSPVSAASLLAAGLVFFVGLGAPPRAVAADPTARPVADLDPATETISPLNGIATTAGDRLLFWGDDEEHGQALWITDGTPSGTRVWADPCPGACRAERPYSPIGRAVWAEDRAFFLIDDTLHGEELWVSDGTREGTRIVADLCPGTCSSEIFFLEAVGDRVFFSLETPATGREPWTSDGTPEGTHSLGDLRPGPLGSFSGRFLPHAGGVVFHAFEETHGAEWWWSDGTPEGTRRITDLCPGPCSAAAGNEIVWRDAVYFSPGFYDTNGPLRPETLYRLTLDEGAEPLLEICETADISCSNQVALLFPAGDRLYLAKEGTLFTSDGTAEGSRAVTGLPGGTSLAGLLALEDGTRLALLRRSVSAALYRIEGDELVGPLIDLVRGQLFGASLGDRVVLVEDAPLAVRLWTSDGTAAGTRALEPLLTGDHLGIGGLVTVDDAVYISAREDFSVGYELYRSDATPRGASLLVGGETRPASGDPRQLTAAGARVVFTADTAPRIDPLAPGADLMTSDGTRAGTGAILQDVEPLDLQTVRVDGDPTRVFFNRRQINDRGQFDFEPAVTTGTRAGLRPLGELESNGRSWAREPIALEDSFYFFADRGPGQKIWRSDGTAASTEVVIDIEPGWRNIHEGCGVCSPPIPPGPIYPRDVIYLPTNYGVDGIAFLARQDETGEEVWVSGGEAHRTGLLADVRPGPEGSAPEHLTAAGGGLFFTADDGTGRALWNWQPETGVVRLASVGEVVAIVELGDGVVYFEQEAGFVAASRSDGAPEGTDTFATWPGAMSVEAVALDGRIYFVAADAEAGAELWATDGSEAGTGRVSDLWPGTPGSYPAQLRVLYGSLYWSAADPEAGRELWRLDPDGSPRRVTDAVPGPGSSSPRDMVAARARIFFSAWGESGRELWSAASDAPLCRDRGGRACLGRDRSRE